MSKSKQPRHWSYSGERIRREVLIRDNYECQIRGEGCLLIATEVDHIVPRSWDGREHPANLRAACRPCNRAKGARGAPSQQGRFFKSAGHWRGPLPNLPPQSSRWSAEARDYTRKDEE